MKLLLTRIKRWWHLKKQRVQFIDPSKLAELYKRYEDKNFYITVHGMPGRGGEVQLWKTFDSGQVAIKWDEWVFVRDVEEHLDRIWNRPRSA